MTGIVPKEKLTAYQRWEMAAFDEAEQAAARAAEAAAAGPVEVSNADDQAQLALPTAAEIERMHIEAHAEGYAAGLAAGTEAGREAGHAEGYAAGHAEGSAAAALETQRIGALMSALQQSVRDVDQHVADQLLATAVEIASQMLRQSLRVKPELLLPVVREAVATLNAHNGHPALFAHPEDASLIRSHLGEQLAHANWRIIDDPTMSPGGCRVELGASEVDATFETRWRRVIEAIGIDAQWLADVTRAVAEHD